jgi:hypothetical protein
VNSVANRAVCLCFLLCTSGGALPEPLPAIRLSPAMPVVGQAASVSVPAGAGKVCRIVTPEGKTTRLSLDAAGHAQWTPGRYGKHTLRCGAEATEAWVLAAPMFFHWWDERSDPGLATVVMTSWPEYWRSRGVVPVRWTVGEYASRTNGEYAARRYIRPEQWLEDWEKSTSGWNGMALDEMYCGPEAPTPAICEAVALLRRDRGTDFLISVYTSGATKGFEEGARRLRDSRALCMIESYYGDDALFRARWNAMKEYGLEKMTIFAIGPGFRLRPDCHGPLTEAEVREEFAKVRRVAPESQGIALYNAFSPADREAIQPALDRASSRAIEDFFLKPVIFLAPTRADGQPQCEAWNIGNEDARGFRVQWIDAAGKAMGDPIRVPELRPQARTRLTVPSATRSAHLLNPPETTNIYPDGCLALP